MPSSKVWVIYNPNTGAIKDNPVFQEIEQFVPPLGYNVLGPLDGTNATVLDAAYNPSHYTVQNSALVMIVTPAQLLAEAQTKQIAAINAGLAATLIGGFTSKTNGHSYVTTTNGQANMEGDLKRFELDSTLTSVVFYTTDSGWISHTQTLLQQAFLDGGKWKDAQYAHAQSLIGQVNTATTVAQVGAITWQAATY